MPKIIIKELDIRFKGVSQDKIEYLTANLEKEISAYMNKFGNSMTIEHPTDINGINTGVFKSTNQLSPSILGERLAKMILYSVQSNNHKDIQEEF